MILIQTKGVSHASVGATQIKLISKGQAIEDMIKNKYSKIRFANGCGSHFELINKMTIDQFEDEFSEFNLPKDVISNHFSNEINLKYGSKSVIIEIPYIKKKDMKVGHYYYRDNMKDVFLYLVKVRIKGNRKQLYGGYKGVYFEIKEVEGYYISDSYIPSIKTLSEKPVPLEYFLISIYRDNKMNCPRERYELNKTPSKSKKEVGISIEIPRVWQFKNGLEWIDFEFLDVEV